MGRTLILLKGENQETHHKIFNNVKAEARKEYLGYSDSLVNSMQSFGFRGRYDTIDGKTYEQISNSDLILKTLGKEIEGLYFYKRGLSTLSPEKEKPLHGLIRADMYGLFTVCNEEFFWNLTGCADKIYPINFEMLMTYQSFSSLISQPDQIKSSPFQLTIDSGPEGVAISTKNPPSERIDVKINPIEPKENEQEYYSFGKCPDEPWSLFPDISKIMKDIEFERAKKSAIEKERKD
jgi:hypothetical protein